MDVRSNEYLMLRRFALGDVFRRNAGMFPDKTALIFPAPDGSVMRYSWSEFNSSVNKVANALSDLGIAKGDKVSIYALNCPQFLFLAYGLTKIGACIAPINVSLTGKDARFVVENCDAKILFILKPTVFVPPPKVDSAFLSMIPKEGKKNINKDLLLFIRMCFQNKRKYLKYALSKTYSVDVIDGIYSFMQFSDTTRAEEVRPDQYEEMYNFLHGEGDNH